MAEITHVVLVQWRADVPAEVKEQARASARGFVGVIPGTVSVVEGPSVSPEGLEQGFDYGLVIRFADAAARDGYLPHPVHRVLADLIGAHAERVVVYDIEA
ncbi:Dabb family protein [Lysobacter korlensis]|uniref:Dabb family protein n=1 Tax=Lysobacter korlensis TaxID=553636 RepID=A0ABV6RP19_9GAMM